MFKNYFNQRKEKSFHWSVMHTWWRQEIFWLWNLRLSKKKQTVWCLWSMCRSCEKNASLSLWKMCAQHFEENMLPTDQVVLSWIYIYLKQHFDFLMYLIFIGVLLTLSCWRPGFSRTYALSTCHMHLDIEWPTDWKGNSQFCIKSWGVGNVGFLHFHCEKCYFVRAKVLYI